MGTIRWSPTTAIYRKGSPGTLIAGSPGSGKTFFLINILANALAMGQRIIGIDPKNDMEKLKNINENVEIISLGQLVETGLGEGALNPFTFLDKFTAPDLLTLVEILNGKLSREEEIAITPILQDFVLLSKRDGKYTDLFSVSDYLYSKDNIHAQSIGTRLNLYKDHAFGKLLFTRKADVKPLKFSDGSFIISLQGLDLPPHDKQTSDYTASERFSAAIVYLLVKKLNEILVKDKKVPVIFACDEAHVLFSNAEMSQTINNFLRQGRSMKVATILLSQGLTHFPKDIAVYLSSKFIFKTSLDEAKMFLRKFSGSALQDGKINEDSIVSEITNFGKIGSDGKERKGQCFFIDMEGRNGSLQVKSIYPPEVITGEKEKNKEVVLMD